MKGFFILFLLFSILCKAQLQQIGFTSDGDAVRAFVELIDSSTANFHNGVVEILSLKDGSTMVRRDVRNLHHSNKLAYSQNDSIVVIVSSSEPQTIKTSRWKSEQKFHNMTVQKFNLHSDAPGWQIDLKIFEECLGCSFMNNDQEFFIITKSQMIVFDASTGEIKRKSNVVSTFINQNITYSECFLSKSGKYFAYLDIKYMTLSRNDEGGCLVGMDFIWYGLRWLTSLGSIPNTLYIYDTQDDKVVAELSIPYETIKGFVGLTSDEKEVLAPCNSNGKAIIYSIPSGKEIRAITQPKNVIGDYEFPFSGNEIISPDKKFLFSPFPGSRFLQSYSDGSILGKFNGSFYPEEFSEKQPNIVLGFDDPIPEINDRLGIDSMIVSEVTLYDLNSNKIVWQRALWKELEMEKKK